MRRRIDITKLKPEEACSIIDGKYDAANNTCNIPLDDTIRTKSIIEKEGIAFFFILQVIGGAIGTIITTYYTPKTFIPSLWWSSYIILGIAYMVATAMYWFRTGSWGEAFLRSSISLFFLGVLSFIIGSIYRWDITAFLSIETFATYPLYSTMSGILISALISIILVAPTGSI